jgi:hypothetical protein
MSLLILLVVAAMVICWVTLWTGLGGEESADPVPAPRRPAPPESLEGALVAQLTAGDIARRQYLHAMERLAARDDERHPLTVPPKAGSAEE